MTIPDKVRRGLEARYLAVGLELDPQKMTAPGLARLVELGFATRTTEKVTDLMQAVADELRRRIDSSTESPGPLLIFDYDGGRTYQSIDELLLLAPVDHMGMYARYIRMIDRQNDLAVESKEQLGNLEASLQRDPGIVRKEAIGLRSRLERDYQWQICALSQAIELNANAEINNALARILEFATTPQWLLRRERYWQSEIDEEFRTVVSQLRADQISIGALARHPLVETLTAVPLAGNTSLLTLIQVISGHSGEDVAAEFCSALRGLQPITWSFHLVHADLASVIADNPRTREEAIVDIGLLCTAVDRSLATHEDQGAETPIASTAAKLYELSLEHFLASIEMSRAGVADDWTLFEASKIANKFACVAMRTPGLTKWLVNRLTETNDVRKATRTAAGVENKNGVARFSYGISRSLWAPALVALIQRWPSWPGASRFDATNRENLFAAAQRAFVVFGLPSGASVAAARALTPDLLKDPSEWTESFHSENASRWAMTSWEYARKFASWDDVKSALAELGVLRLEDRVVLLSVFQSGLRQRSWEGRDVLAWLQTETAKVAVLSTQDEDLFEVFLHALLSWSESGTLDERRTVGSFLAGLYGASELNRVAQRVTLVYVVMCCVRWCKLAPLSLALRKRNWSENVANADYVRSTIDQISISAPAWIRAQLRATLASLPPPPLRQTTGQPH